MIKHTNSFHYDNYKIQHLLKIDLRKSTQKRYLVALSIIDTSSSPTKSKGLSAVCGLYDRSRLSRHHLIDPEVWILAVF